MILELKGEGKRFYLWRDGKKLKVIPKAFLGISAEEIMSCITDDTKKTLNERERQKLAPFQVVAQAKRLISKYLEKLRKTEKYVYELIKDSEPVKALLVNVNGADEPRYEIEFSNGRRVKCSEEIYELFEPKGEVFSNY